MQYLIQERNVIYRDSQGQIHCQRLEKQHHSIVAKRFYLKSDYDRQITSITDVISEKEDGEKNQLIAGIFFYIKPGFIEELGERLGPRVAIIPDLEIMTQDLAVGEHLIFDIGATYAYKYTIIADENGKTITSRVECDNAELNNLLKAGFRDYLNTELTAGDLAHELFDQFNILNIIELLKNCGDPEGEGLSQFNFYNSELDRIFTNEITLSFFFETLTRCIMNFVARYSDNNRTIHIKSALVSLPHIQTGLCGQGIVCINELDFVSSVRETKFNYKRIEDRYGVKCYQAQVNELPASGWLISEIDRLRIDAFEGDGTQEILIPVDFQELSGELAETSFSINNKQLVKVHIDCYDNGYGHLNMRLRTVSNRLFYHLIKDMQ